MIEQNIKDLTAAVNELTAAVKSLNLQAEPQTCDLEDIEHPDKDGPAENSSVEPTHPPEPAAEKLAEQPAKPSPEPAKEPDTQPAKAAQESAEPAPEPVEPSTETVTQDDLKLLVKKVFEAKGGDTVTQVMKEFNETRVSDLDPERYNEFAAKLKAVLNG